MAESIEYSDKKNFCGILYEYGLHPNDIWKIEYSNYSLKDIKQNPEILNELFEPYRSKEILKIKNIINDIPDVSRGSIFDLYVYPVSTKAIEKLYYNGVTIQMLKNMNAEQLHERYKIKQSTCEDVFSALRYYEKVYEKNNETDVYAKLYEDGTLILSSYDYVDKGKKLIRKYICGDIPPKDRKIVKNIIILDKIIISKNDYFMKHCFNKLNKVKKLDLKNLDYSNVTDLSDMFNGCENLEELNISNFNTSKVTDMSNMFSFCKELKTLDLSSFDTSNVTNMSGMFSFCKKLKTINLSSFDTSNVREMTMMFSECNDLEMLDLSTFNTSNLEHMRSMFRGCKNLKTLDLSSFNISKVDDTSYMFYGCENLRTLNLSNFDISKVIYNYDMFIGCKNLNKDNFKNIYIVKKILKDLKKRGDNNIESEQSVHIYNNKEDTKEIEWRLENDNEVIHTVDRHIIESELNKVDLLETEYLILMPSKRIKDTNYLQVCIDETFEKNKNENHKFYVELNFGDLEQNAYNLGKDSLTKEEVLKIFIDYFENNNLPNIKD